MFLYIPKLLGMYCFQKKSLKQILYRLGLFKQPLLGSTSSTVWIHAVSLGEVRAAYPFLLALTKELPQATLALSCITEAGYRQALEYKHLLEHVFYLPFDFPYLMKRLVARLQPKLFVMVEGDIWPELLSSLKECGVQVMLINGKMSERSLKNYLMFPAYTRWVLSTIDTVCVQTQAHAEMFQSLKVAPQHLHVTGNMKCDYPLKRFSKEEQFNLKISCTFKAIDRLIVLASTHPGEELHLLSKIKSLLTESVKCILVPRHIHRCDAIETLLCDLDLSYSRFSDPKPAQVLLVDAMGVLTRFYEIADLAIVGGSFENIGGHNILEPLFYGKPTLFGPYMHHQKELKRLVLDNHLGKQVCYESIHSVAQAILQSNQELDRVRIEEFFETHRGATERNLLFAKKLLNFE